MRLNFLSLEFPIPFINPMTDRSEIERCDKIFDELNKLKN